MIQVFSFDRSTICFVYQASRPAPLFIIRRLGLHVTKEANTLLMEAKTDLNRAWKLVGHIEKCYDEKLEIIPDKELSIKN